MDTTIGFTILGRAQARVHGELRADWARPQEQRIVAALLTQPGKPMSRRTLVEWAWPEHKPPSNFDSTFHTYTGRIREALATLDFPARVVPVANTLRIEVDEMTVDYKVFQILLRQARQARRDRDHALALRLAQAAVDLFPDEEPLAGMETERAEAWRRHVLQNAWLPATNLVLEQLIAIGDLDSALARLDELSLDHGDEPMLAARRVEVLHRLDRDADATSFYLDARKKLLANGDDGGENHLRHIHNELIYSTPDNTEEAHTELRSPVSLPIPYQLPPDVPYFVGRTIYLDKLDRMSVTADGRFRPGVVVLIGLSGVGKTTLATRWAYRQLGKLIDNVLCVDMRGDPGASPLAPDAVIDELLRALDFPLDRLTNSQAKAGKLAELLQGRRTLVLLDNARNSDQVAPLLRPLSSCIVIVTCRTSPTGLITRHGARPLNLSQLHQQEATDLLARQLGARAEQQPAIVEQLALLSDGFPLALLLIGNRVDLSSGVPLRELISELQDRLLEIGGTEDGINRNLRAAFALSHEALPPEGQRLFRMLGIHPRRKISLHAAAALAGRSIKETQRCVDMLLRAQLLQPAGAADRYRCHDLVRRYATEMATNIEPEERQLAELRMLSFYFHASFNAHKATSPSGTRVPLIPLADGVILPEFRNYAEGNGWLLRERKNLNAVVAWSAEHNYTEYTWRIPHNLHAFYRLQGMYEEIVTTFETAISCAQKIGNVEAEAASRNDLGLALLKLGRHTEASRQLNLAVAIAQQMQNKVGISTSLLNLAKLEAEINGAKGSLELLDQALDLAKAARNYGRQAAILHYGGTLHRDQGQRDKAMSNFQQALWLRQEIIDEHGQAETLTEIASLLCGLGQYAQAEATCQEAVDIVDRIHDMEVGPRTCAVLATIHADQRNFPLAIECGRHAVRLSRYSRNTKVEAESLHTLGHAHHGIGNLDAAGEGWRRALEIYTDLGDVERAQHLAADLTELTGSQPSIPPSRDES